MGRVGRLGKNDKMVQTKISTQKNKQKKDAKMPNLTSPKYPQVSVELIGKDGNAFLVLGKICKALRKAGASQSEIDQFKTEATSGDYDNLLRVCMEWITVE